MKDGKMFNQLFSQYLFPQMLKKRKRKRQFQNVQQSSICTVIRDDKLAIYITENSFKETALSQNKV